MLSIGVLLALHTIVSHWPGPGRARLLAALDHAIDTYPRTTTEEP